MVLMLLDAGLGEANPDRVGTLQLTDEILRSKAAFGVVEEEIARGLNLGALAEQDYWKLRGPVLLEIQTEIHARLREQFGKIVHAVDFGPSSTSDSPSQSPSTDWGDKPILHKKASEIIRDFIVQKHISVIVMSDAPVGGSEVLGVRRLGGEIPFTYDIIKGACVVIPVEKFAALIKLPFITEIWPNSEVKPEWSKLQQIGADRVHTPRPTGLGVTGKGVVVGVVDTGIDSSHPEFENRLLDARGILGGFRDTDDLDDNADEGHGTHVAGIIGAKADGKGMTGVAPEVKFLDASTDVWYINTPGHWAVYGTTNSMMAGILWSAQNDPGLFNANTKADVINMSMGWIDPWKYTRDGSDPLCQVIDQVVSHGIIVVLAAGNEGKRRDSGSFTLSPNATLAFTRHNLENFNPDFKVEVTLIWNNSVNDLDLVILDKNGVVLCESRNNSGFFSRKAWKEETNHGTFYEQVKCSSDDGIGITVQVEGHSVQVEQKYEVWVSDGLKFSSPDSSQTLGGPGYSKKAITVGNVDYSNTLNPSSSQGPSTTLIKPEVVAPGTNICSAIVSEKYSLSGKTYNHSERYGHETGTSMAAPHVAGVAALILDAVGKNSNGKWNFSPDEVKSAIVRGAERGIGGIPNTPKSEYGAGLVKADNIIFGGTVPSGGKLRFKITPQLLGSRFGKYFLNAENAYPNENLVSLTAAISWENRSHDLDLLLSHANGNPARAVRQTGADYKKISRLLSPTSASVYYLDVVNGSGVPVPFTGASTHPIKSLIAPDESNIHIEALDVTCDGVVNVVDLWAVAKAFGSNYPWGEDVDGDGDIDLDDLELIAAELEDAAGAPAVPTVSRATLETVQQWLSEANRMQHTDPNFLRGLAILEQLLALVIPAETVLLPNYPNPLNPETWIPYQLAAPAEVTLTIYDVNGHMVRALALGHQAAGIYHGRSRAAYWDGRNAQGEPVASGVYFYTLTAGDFTATRKMLIRK